MITEIKTYDIHCDKCLKKITLISLKDIILQLPTWEIISNCYPISTTSKTKVLCPDCKELKRITLRNSTDIRDKINGGYYDDFPEKFRPDALEYCGLTSHPKADKFFSKAVEHSSGNSEILNFLEELSELS